MGSRSSTLHGPALDGSIQDFPLVNWVPDSETDMCMLCGDRFTTLRRRHHCRSCGKLMCNACTTQRTSLPQLGYDAGDPQRVCTYCFSVIKTQAEPLEVKLQMLYEHLHLMEFEQIDWKLVQRLAKINSQADEIQRYFKSAHTAKELARILFNAVADMASSLDVETKEFDKFENALNLFTVVDRVVHAKVCAGAVSDAEMEALTKRLEPFSEAVLEKTTTLKLESTQRLKMLLEVEKVAGDGGDGPLSLKSISVDLSVVDEEHTHPVELKRRKEDS
eukprot:TRINITY_DN319_c0_g1_i1.p1 TRINITY_DN319_c0_g1~~TRINITY_DN319_c0_g1_i1.p1  ORF type:complete len:276 (+),score=61.57 TRINITY_DN319_c0_g1_i1:670-1497(+)